MCFKESWFPDCWKMSYATPIFKNVMETYVTNNYCIVTALYVVSKIIDKTINSSPAEHLKECFFLIFKMILAFLT